MRIVEKGKKVWRSLDKSEIMKFQQTLKVFGGNSNVQTILKDTLRCKPTIIEGILCTIRYC